MGSDEMSYRKEGVDYPEDQNNLFDQTFSSELSQSYGRLSLCFAFVIKARAALVSRKRTREQR